MLREYFHQNSQQNRQKSPQNFIHSKFSPFRGINVGVLGGIIEEDEEESDDDELVDLKEFGGAKCLEVSLTDPNELPQTFSHYTHVRSKGKLMVTDLQGTFSEDSNKYEFTDPVCHKSKTKKTLGRDKDFGRTNLGRKGFVAFYKTHHCNGFCKALGECVSENFSRSKWAGRVPFSVSIC